MIHSVAGYVRYRFSRNTFLHRCLPHLRALAVAPAGSGDAGNPAPRLPTSPPPGSTTIQSLSSVSVFMSFFLLSMAEGKQTDILHLRRELRKNNSLLHITYIRFVRRANALCSRILSLYLVL
jgi:hypothetical protein